MITDAANERVIDAEEQIVEPSFSWWTLAYVITQQGAQKLLAENKLYPRHLFVIDEFLPLVIESINITAQETARVSTQSFFSKLPRLKAISWKFEALPAHLQWDSHVQGTNTYNSDVSRAPPYVLLEQLLNGMFALPVDNLGAPGRLVAGENELTVVQQPLPDATETTADDKTVYSDEGLFVLMTVATDYNGGYQRFVKSCHRFGMPFRTLGYRQKWEGGDMTGPGGGHKVNLLRKGLEDLEQSLTRHCTTTGADSDALEACRRNITARTVVVFSDSYDVVLAGDPRRIATLFWETPGAPDVIFSAEPFCWPEPELDVQYPTHTSSLFYKYLNSGEFCRFLFVCLFVCLLACLFACLFDCLLV